jgi:sugar O-acyltransferase (sialic acid O-acetyltransferase NeuD family)
MPQKNDLVIVGTGGHANSVFGLVNSLGFQVRYFLDQTSSVKNFLGLQVISSLDEISNYKDFSFVIAIGDNNSRMLVQESLLGFLPISSFPSFIHQSAIIAKNSDVGFGTCIFPLSNVGTFAKVGDFCILNTGSNLEHDSVLGSFSALGPGAIAGGRVQIGTGSWIGMNASIKQGITIGNDSIVGAQSYVDKDIPSNVVVYGAPAKVVRTRESHDKFL